MEKISHVLKKSRNALKWVEISQLHLDLEIGACPMAQTL